MSIEQPSNNLDDFIRCEICMELFGNPQSLSCGHVFCSSCCAKMIKHRKLTCPICRKVCRARHLRTDYHTQSLVDTYTLCSESNSSSALETSDALKAKKSSHYEFDSHVLVDLSIPETREPEETLGQAAVNEAANEQEEYLDASYSQPEPDPSFRNLPGFNSLASFLQNDRPPDDEAVENEEEVVDRSRSSNSNVHLIPRVRNSSIPRQYFPVTENYRERSSSRPPSRSPSIRRVRRTTSCFDIFERFDKQEAIRMCKMLGFLMLAMQVLGISVTFMHYYFIWYPEDYSDILNIADNPYSLQEAIDEELEKSEEMKLRELEEVEEKCSKVETDLKEWGEEMSEDLTQIQESLQMKLKKAEEDYKDKITAAFNYRQDMLAKVRDEGDSPSMIAALKEFQMIYNRGGFNFSESLHVHLKKATKTLSDYEDKLIMLELIETWLPPVNYLQVLWNDVIVVSAVTLIFTITSANIYMIAWFTRRFICN